MGILPIIFAALGGLILLLLLVLVVRALAFKPKADPERDDEKIEIDVDKAVNGLAEMVRCKTVSDKDHSLEDEAEFDKFKALLPKLFPHIYETCTLEVPGPRSLLFRWQGETPGDPTVLMSHFDVVSVVEENWEKPAFDGVMEDGVLWGRGTLDTKGTLNGVMQAAETLIAQGFVPKHDVYFAFAGDEEVNGTGAQTNLDLFLSKGLKPGLVVDEGGAVVTDIFPGVKGSCALIGVAEKGPLNVLYSVTGGGGHASSPKPHTPVGVLSAACCAVENHPFKFRLTPPVAAMFDTLGRRSTFVYKLIFANLWFFRPILDKICKKSGGELNGLVRTTVAFTQMQGSKGMNVIPPYASMVSNIRLMAGDTVDSAIAYLKKTVGNDKVDVQVIEGENPSKISSMDCEAYERLSSVVASTWREAVVSPYLMIACSDSRRWSEISDKVYRFSAMELSKEERATIHGNNERVPFTTIAKTVEFYIRLMKKS